MIQNFIPNVPTNPYGKTVPLRNPENVDLIVLHTADAEYTVMEMCEYAISPQCHIMSDHKGCPIPMYSMFVERDGSSFLVNPPEYKGYHAGAFNTNSFGVSMGTKVTGMSPDTYITPAIRASVYDCLHNAVLHFDGAQITFHRYLPKTGFHDYNGNGVKDTNEPFRKTCPGMGWDLDDVIFNVNCLLQITYGNYIGQGQDVDGILTKEQAEFVSQYRKIKKVEPNDVSILLGQFTEMSTNPEQLQTPVE